MLMLLREREANSVVIPGRERERANPESITPSRGYGFRIAACAASGMTAEFVVRPASAQGASKHLVAVLHRGGLVDVHLAAHRLELLAHLLHAGLCGIRVERGLLVVAEACRIVAHVLRDLHRAELRTAHRAEVRDLVRFFRQRLVVVLARGVRIETQVELVLPAEVEARTRECIVAKLRRWMAL